MAAGQHVVEIEWFTHAAVTAQLRDRTLTIQSALPSGGVGRLSVASSTSAATIGPSPGVIPALSTTFRLAQAGRAAVTFSAKLGSHAGRLFVGAVVDGSEVDNVLFVDSQSSAFAKSGRYTFLTPPLAAGNHTVSLRGWVEGGSVAIYDRTLAVSAAPATSATGGQVVTGAQQAPTTVTGAWTDVQAASTVVTTSAKSSTLVIDGGAEVSAASGRVFLRGVG